MGQILSNIGDVNFINKYFIDIATDVKYDRLEVTKYLFNDLVLDSAKVKCIEDFDVQRKLAGVYKNASGDDSMLPYWLFKHCSYALASIASDIFNLSFSIGRPLKAWNNAIISPVPQVSPRKNVSDLRSISVTPILSRLCESYLVKHYLLPALHKVDITDQFAFFDQLVVLQQH